MHMFIIRKAIIIIKLMHVLADRVWTFDLGVAHGLFLFLNRFNVTWVYMCN